MKLFVGGLPYRVTNQELADLFGQVGQVVSANVIVDRETGRSKGFGFVEMSNDQEANDAIARFNNTTLGDRNITANEARERQDSRPRGGGGYQRRGGERRYGDNNRY